jgi:methyl-accepting chemotaxis protein
MESVEDGQALVNHVDKALQQIAVATESTAKLVKDISVASVDQTTRTNEAVALFESISHITEQTAAGAQETAASSQSLSEMAQQLQAMLDEFRQ